MEKEIFAVVETVKFIRVRNFAKGYKGKYAVCEGECNGNPCKIFVADEEFPFKVLNKINEGTDIKVNPNDRGLRAAKIEYQDLEIIKLTQQDLSVELAEIKTSIKNAEQRRIERDTTLFKWMEWVEEAIHLNTKDINKYREIIFHAPRDEDDD